MSDPRSTDAVGRTRDPFRVRLPSFVNEEEVGLGDAVKRATRALGVRPCAGCERRARTLNRWVRVGGRNR
jgi:hypothetical protein